MQPDLRNSSIGPRLVLASGSPRRHDLLRQLGVTFLILAPDIDETPHHGETPDSYVERLALEKARAGTRLVPADTSGFVLLAADTTVALHGEILGKPTDNADAASMLRRLSGRAHLVHTGIALTDGARTEVRTVTTQVEFAELNEHQISWYIESGEPFGKAGSYALQGLGGSFIRSVSGNVQNVIGLPMTDVIELIAGFGVQLPVRAASSTTP